MTEIPAPSEQQEIKTTLDDELRSYFSYFYNDEFVGFSIDPTIAGNEGLRRKDFIESIIQETTEVITRNNEIADVLSSDEYREITQKEKDELRGDCALGINFCIDGRIPRLFIAGLTGKIWETGAGIVATRVSPRDNKAYPASAKLEESLEERVQKEPANHLQVLFAHTSLSEHNALKRAYFLEKPKHCCGAMNEQNLPPGTDMVQANLDIHRKGAEAMLNTYNKAARKHRKPELDQLAVTAVFDTDTMGIIVGYGTKQELFTSNLTEEILVYGGLGAELREQELIGKPDQFKDTFTDPSRLVALEEKLYQTTKFLMQHAKFGTALYNYIQALEPQLTPKQVRSYQFILTRNMSFQYHTGVHRQDNEHVFNHHHEGYISSSKDGVVVGAFDPEAQSFGTTVATTDEANAHALIAMKIMDNNSGVRDEQGNKKSPRKYYFLAKAVSDGQTNGSLGRARSSLHELYNGTKDNKLIFDKVKRGEVVLIPVSVNDRTHKILHVIDFD